MSYFAVRIVFNIRLDLVPAGMPVFFSSRWLDMACLSLALFPAQKRDGIQETRQNAPHPASRRIY